MASAAGSQPKVLHICAAFAKQALYKQLVQALSEFGLSQCVFVPVRSDAELKKRPPDTERIRFIFERILDKSDRIFFGRKIRKIFDHLQDAVDFKEIGLVHAHFLYSDGAVALAVHEQCNIPYIVAVRNTDLNFFMKYRPDLDRRRADILKHAEQVVFLSPAYLDAFSGKISRGERQLLNGKATIIPNGLDDTWFTGAARLMPNDGVVNLLYVGDFSKNKNVLKVIDAVEYLNSSSDSERYHLTLVGGGGRSQSRIIRRLEGLEKYVEFKGRIHDQEALKSIYRQNDIFVMPSITETFGLVYIEALCQGLSVIHSEGQGIAGYFDDLPHLCRAVKPGSVDSIAAAIRELSRLRLRGSRPASLDRLRSNFSWTNIALNYYRMYHGAM